MPNIRFNFAKVMEAIWGRLSNGNRLRVEEALRKMSENEKIDFDVKYYAEKAL